MTGSGTKAGWQIVAFAERVAVAGVIKLEQQTFEEEIRVTDHQLVETVKKLVHEANVRRIIINNDKGDKLLKIPVSIPLRHSQRPATAGVPVSGWGKQYAIVSVSGNCAAHLW